MAEFIGNRSPVMAELEWSDDSIPGQIPPVRMRVLGEDHGQSPSETYVVFPDRDRQPVRIPDSSLIVTGGEWLTGPTYPPVEYTLPELEELHASGRIGETDGELRPAVQP